MTQQGILQNIGDAMTTFFTLYVHSMMELLLLLSSL